MTIAPPSPEFKPTGVWLEHFGVNEEPPTELFRQFAAGGGTGVILDIFGLIVPSQSTKFLELAKDQGLQTILSVSYQVLSNATGSNEGLEPEPLATSIDLADAVLVTLGSGPISPVDLNGLVPEKPWLVLARHHAEPPQIIRNAYPGALMGFMLGRPVTRNDEDWPFPSPQEARESVDEWVKNLEGLEPVFYSVPFIIPLAPHDSIASIPDIAAAVREVGVRALVIESRDYDRYPEITEVTGRLARFPAEITRPGQSGRVVGTHQRGVWSVAVTPGGQVVSGGEDGAVRLWDSTGGEKREPLGQHDGAVRSVAVTPDGQVVTGGTDGTVRLWDLVGGEEREPLGRHGGEVWSVAATPGGQVVSGGNDGTVRVWDLAGGGEREPLGRQNVGVWSVAVTPGGQVVSGGTDGTVRLWDRAEGADSEPLGRHEGEVWSVAVTPGGQVISGGEDGAVRLWDLTDGVEREPLGRHDGAVYSVAVTPGGQVVSGGHDGTVRLWDLAGSEDREPLGRHDGLVRSVAVTPGGQVVSGGEDGTVRLWDIPGSTPFTPPPPVLDMQTRATSDAASSVDRLGFDQLVRALDEMLNHPLTGLPLAIAITAPWGAGKSSVMRQLQERLRSNSDDGADRFRRTWYTVDFPAWKYEKSERLWAALAKKMYEDPQKQMPGRKERLGFRLRLPTR